MITNERLRLFAISNQMAERELDQVEKRFLVDLEREQKEPLKGPEADYYLQFEASIRSEAQGMARHYEVFYSLERSIRTLIAEILKGGKGADWWNTSVPEPVSKNVAANIKREKQHAVTPRSVDEIDYTTFGELGEIVRHNWPEFSDIFNDEIKAFSKVMTSLNVLRGPIAHCSVLAPDEIVRLNLTVKDWFRLME